jgi:hypothetical protein
MYVTGVVGEFLWSDGTVGPADARLLPPKPAALTWREPMLLTRLMAAGLAVALIGLAAVPLSWVIPSLRTRSNCLFHAFGQMQHEGGFVIFMASEHGWWTHCLHTCDFKRFEEYYPKVTPMILKRLTWKHKRPPVLFRGTIQPWVLVETPQHVGIEPVA